ncbi:MAG: hypothetical protein N2319_08020 [Candidatus Kapabacteria bacterium]|nr:hypothetical protein [Candidatus Kapabacteria bacterium]
MDRFNLIFIFLISLLLWSCSSPMDLDTPKEKRLVGNPPAKVFPKINTILLEENGIAREFVAKDYSIAVDTSKDIPLIWMNFLLDSYDNKKSTERISINNINFRIDSTQLTGQPIKIVPNIINPTCWAKYTINRGLNIQSDTTINSGDSKNITELSFSYNKSRKEIWAYIYSKIYDHKVWKEQKDTVVYDTTWVGGVPNIKEIRLRLEEIRTKQDSLFLNTKLLLKY